MLNVGLGQQRQYSPRSFEPARSRAYAQLTPKKCIKCLTGYDQAAEQKLQTNRHNNEIEMQTNRHACTHSNAKDV